VTSLYEQVVRATVEANRRADEAEARCKSLERLLVAEQSRGDRVSAEADALYQMLPEEIRPTT
jgi:hypothetical protein